MYTDLVTDLRRVKNVIKAVKWADVVIGPLFDAATVGVSAWQLAEAIKNKDPAAIASSSLSLPSGLAGITGFVVSALATTGSGSGCWSCWRTHWRHSWSGVNHG